MRTLLILATASMALAQMPPGGSSIPRCLGARTANCAAWLGADGFLGIGGIAPVVPLHVYSARTSNGLADSQVYSVWEFGLGANNAVSSVQGFYRNTGSTASSTSHGIGVLGKVEDTTAGAITLFGAEGRVDGRATSGAATHGYVGLVGAGVFQGASRGAYLYGVEGLVSSTTDGVTPLNEGPAVAFYAPAIIGGAAGQKFGLYVNDPARMTDATIDGTARVTSGPATTPAAGKGIELTYSSALDYGLIAAADRTTPSYKPLIIQGSLLALYVGASPMATLTSEGLQLGPGVEPVCNESKRNTVVLTNGGPGVGDTGRICRKDSSDNYAWAALY